MNIVAVTACPTGIAHSQMGAEALERAATAADHDVHVEVRGAMGTQNALDAADIEAADVAVVAADVRVDVDRFADLPLVKAPVTEAVNDPAALVERAEATAGGDPATADPASERAGGESDAAGVLGRLGRLFR
jgi:PTS system fructose-specific IIB component